MYSNKKPYKSEAQLVTFGSQETQYIKLHCQNFRVMFKLCACSVLTLSSGYKLEDIRVLSDKLLDCIDLIKGKFNCVLVLAPTVYIHGPELQTRGFQLSSRLTSRGYMHDGQ